MVCSTATIMKQRVAGWSQDMRIESLKWESEPQLHWQVLFGGLAVTFPRSAVLGEVESHKGS